MVRYNNNRGGGWNNRGVGNVLYFSSYGHPVRYSFYFEHSKEQGN